MMKRSAEGGSLEKSRSLTILGHGQIGFAKV